MKTLMASMALVALVAVGLSLISCDEHDHPVDVPAEPPTSTITVREDDLEAFIEHPYPVAGVPARFITHISDLSTGEPRRAGAITYELAGPAGESLEHSQERPDRDGIYLPSITFPTAGAWKVSVRVPAQIGKSIRVRLPDVLVYGSAEEARNAPAEDEIEGISFLKEQQWKLAMVTKAAARKRLSARRKFPGHVLHKTGYRVSISSPVSGRLVGLDSAAFPSRGRVVQAGEVLGLVEPTLPSADLLSLAVKIAEAEAAELRAAQALKLANATLARVTQLRKANAKSARELEQTQFDAEAAKTAHEAAIAIQASYERARSYTDSYRPSGDDDSGLFGRLALKAPISGTVVHVDTAPGERVKPSVALFVILDSSTVYVEAKIPQYEAPTLGAQPEAYLEVHAEGAENAQRLPLSLLYSGLEVEEATHAVPLLYEAQNRNGLLRVGMLVDVFVEVAPPRDALAIPESAIVDQDGKHIAFVQVSGETFEQRELSLGIRDHGFLEVLDGLEEGERVVTSEPWSIRLASLSTEIEARGHHH